MRVPTSLAWLFLDLNSYFASVEQQLNPGLRGRPIVVSPVESDATCAIAASYEAKAYGIKTGTPIYEALRLCPDVIVVNARHDLYVTFHHRILAAVETCLPISRVCSIDEVACQLMGDERQPGHAIKRALAIKQAIANHVGECLTCSIGLAPNVLLAKIASDMRKPNGLTLIEPDYIYEKINALPLADIPGVGRMMQRRLAQAGLQTIADFWALTPKQARRLWGSVLGERLWWEIRGYDLPASTAPRRTLGHSHVLSPQLRAPCAARQVARRLTAKAATRLRRYGLTTSRLMLSIRLEDRQRLSCERAFNATQESLALLRLVEQGWQQLSVHFGEKARVKKVSIVFFKLEAVCQTSHDLFQTPPPRLREQLKLAHAIDRLNARYGKDTVSFGLRAHSAVNRYTGTKIAFTRIPDAQEFHE
jgi:DNA polymerase IV